MIMDIAGWKTPMLSNYRHKDTLKSAQAIRLTHLKPVLRNTVCPHQCDLTQWYKIHYKSIENGSISG
jgi:hypothetical protein